MDGACAMSIEHTTRSTKEVEQKQEKHCELCINMQWNGKRQIIA